MSYKAKIIMFTLTTPKELRLTLASRLKALRLAENLSQATLAKKAGVSFSSFKIFIALVAR